MLHMTYFLANTLTRAGKYHKQKVFLQFSLIIVLVHLGVQKKQINAIYTKELWCFQARLQSMALFNKISSVQRQNMLFATVYNQIFPGVQVCNDKFRFFKCNCRKYYTCGVFSFFHLNSNNESNSLSLITKTGNTTKIALTDLQQQA